MLYQLSYRSEIADTHLYEEGDSNPCDLRQQILSLPPLVWMCVHL